MSIWKMKESQVSGDEDFLLQQASESDLQNDQVIIIRDATMSDVPAMLIAEHRAWPKESQRATRQILEARISTFSESTKIAVRGHEVLGIVSVLIEDYPWDNHPKTYFIRTDHGLIRNCDPMGDTISGTNIGVVPEAPPHVATALMQSLVAMAIKKGVAYGLSSPRIPGYHKVKEQMSAEAYASAKDEQGQPVDPVIRMHANLGMELVGVLDNYYPDEESCNCAGLMKWTNPFLPFYQEERFNHSTQKKETRLIFALPTGCFWAKQANGGCTMCGFHVGVDQFWQLASVLGVTLTDFVGIFDRALLHLKDAACIDFFTGGSFWEVPDQIITSVFKRMNNIRQIHEVMVESRPEFITSDNILKLKELARPGLSLKVAIGLESATDEIRGKNINKGFSRDDYQKAVELLRSHGLIPCTYVLIKPLDLSEKEAIAETVETIKWSSEVGSQLTLLQAAFVQAKTKVAAAFNQGKYRPPWLWSILEILRQLSGRYDISLGRFTDYPPPLAIAHNCGACDPELNDLFDIYRRTNTLRCQLPQCECFKTWQKEVA